MSDWNSKVVVVTGGSAGLGRSIGTAFAERGATVVLLARQIGALQEVASSHSDLNLDFAICDVTIDESVDRAISEVVNRHGRIDVWVNNVGSSTRTKLEECSIADYQRLIELNLYSAIRCTSRVMEELTKSNGQVVNIGSLAAKTGWPNVAPYSVSKHALAAYSHQLRIEGPENINCLFVCTGPIRRDDAGSRYNEEAKGLDDNAKRPGAGVNLKGICPNQLSQRIVKCCERRKKELVVPWYARLQFAISQISPTLGDFLLLRNKKK